MPDPNEAREAAWRAFADEYTRWVVRGRGIDEPIEFDYAWDARGRYDEQRIAELVAVGREIWAHRFDECSLPPDIQEQLGRALGQSEEVEP